MTVSLYDELREGLVETQRDLSPRMASYRHSLGAWVDTALLGRPTGELEQQARASGASDGDAADVSSGIDRPALADALAKLTATDFEESLVRLADVYGGISSAGEETAADPAKVKSRIKAWETTYGVEIPGVGEMLDREGTLSALEQQEVGDRLTDFSQQLSDSSTWLLGLLEVGALRLRTLPPWKIRLLKGTHWVKTNKLATVAIILLAVSAYLSTYLLVDPVLVRVKEKMKAWEANPALIWPIPEDKDGLRELLPMLQPEVAAPFYDRIFEGASLRLVDEVCQATFAIPADDENAVPDYGEGSRWRAALSEGEAWKTATDTNKTPPTTADARAFFDALPGLARAFPVSAEAGTQPSIALKDLSELGGLENRSRSLAIVTALIAKAHATWGASDQIPDFKGVVIDNADRPGSRLAKGVVERALCQSQVLAFATGSDGVAVVDSLKVLAAWPASTGGGQESAGFRLPGTDETKSAPYDEAVLLNSVAMAASYSRALTILDEARQPDPENGGAARVSLATCEVAMSKLDRSADRAFGSEPGLFWPEIEKGFRVRFDQQWRALLEARLAEFPWEAAVPAKTSEPWLCMYGPQLAPSLTDATLAEVWGRFSERCSDKLKPRALDVRIATLRQIETMVPIFRLKDGEAFHDSLPQFLSESILLKNLRVILQQSGSASGREYSEAFAAIKLDLRRKKGDTFLDPYKRARRYIDELTAWGKARGARPFGSKPIAQEVWELKLALLESLVDAMPLEEQPIVGWEEAGKILGELEEEAGSQSNPGQRWKWFKSFYDSLMAARDPKTGHAVAVNTYAKSMTKPSPFGDKLGEVMRRELIHVEVERGLRHLTDNEAGHIRLSRRSLMTALGWTKDLLGKLKAERAKFRDNGTGNGHIPVEDRLKQNHYEAIQELCETFSDEVFEYLDPAFKPLWPTGANQKAGQAGVKPGAQYPFWFLWTFYHDGIERFNHKKSVQIAGLPFVRGEKTLPKFDGRSGKLESVMIRDVFRNLGLNEVARQRAIHLLAYLQRAGRPRPFDPTLKLGDLNLGGGAITIHRFFALWERYRAALELDGKGQQQQLLNELTRVEQETWAIVNQKLTPATEPFLWGQFAILHDLAATAPDPATLPGRFAMELIKPNAFEATWAHMDPIGLMTLGFMMRFLNADDARVKAFGLLRQRLGAFLQKNYYGAQGGPDYRAIFGAQFAVVPQEGKNGN